MTFTVRYYLKVFLLLLLLLSFQGIKTGETCRDGYLTSAVDILDSSQPAYERWNTADYQ